MSELVTINYSNEKYIIQNFIIIKYLERLIQQADLPQNTCNIRPKLPAKIKTAWQQRCWGWQDYAPLKLS